jgi:hypothetical protein
MNKEETKETKTIGSVNVDVFSETIRRAVAPIPLTIDQIIECLGQFDRQTRTFEVPSISNTVITYARHNKYGGFIELSSGTLVHSSVQVDMGIVVNGGSQIGKGVRLRGKGVISDTFMRGNIDIADSTIKSSRISSKQSVALDQVKVFDSDLSGSLTAGNASEIFLSKINAGKQPVFLNQTKAVKSEILGPLEAKNSEIKLSEVRTDHMVFFDNARVIETTLDGYGFKIENSVLQKSKLHSEDVAQIKDTTVNNWEAFGLRGALMIARA